METTVVSVVSKGRVGIEAAAFRGSVMSFGGGSSILALLVRLKCLTFGRGGRVTCVPGRRLHGRLVSTIRRGG